MAGDPACVVGVDAIEDLVDFANETAAPGLLFKCGWSAQCVHEQLQESDFDAIHVGYAVSAEALEQLMSLLGENGIVIAPVYSSSGPQRLIVTRKRGNDIQTHDVGATMCQRGYDGPFVPPKTRAETLKEVKIGLERWKADFERQAGKKPTREDIHADDSARKLFAHFAKLRKYSEK